MWLVAYVTGCCRGSHARRTDPQKWDRVIMVMSAVLRQCLCVEMEWLRMHTPTVPHVVVQGGVGCCGSLYSTNEWLLCEVLIVLRRRTYIYKPKQKKTRKHTHTYTSRYLTRISKKKFREFFFLTRKDTSCTSRPQRVPKRMLYLI